MGRNSSGTRGGLQPGDATYKGSVGKPEPLVRKTRLCIRQPKKLFHAMIPYLV